MSPGFATGLARQALGEAGIRAAVERSVHHYLHTRGYLVRLPVGVPVRAVRAGRAARTAGR